MVKSGLVAVDSQVLYLTFRLLRQQVFSEANEKVKVHYISVARCVT